MDDIDFFYTSNIATSNIDKHAVSTELVMINAVNI